MCLSLDFRLRAVRQRLGGFPALLTFRHQVGRFQSPAPVPPDGCFPRTAARLTLSDGREVTARHPVIVGDSLAWADGSRGSPPGAAWNAVPVSSVWRVKERRLDAPRTFLLLAVLGGLALGVRALYIGYVNAID